MKPKKEVPRCGLCGKRKNLIRAECCGNWICNDEDKYVEFTYALNSCHRNHRRLTLCGYHRTESHAGDWKTCKKCRKSFGTEMYVWYGTNEFNFEKLENTPAFKPTYCSHCGTVIHLGTEGYSITEGKYYCESCAQAKLEGIMEIDETKIDNTVLALLFLTSFTDHGVTRAWKGQNWDTMNRLYDKGMIADPKTRAKSVCLTEEGANLSEKLFHELFGRRG